MPAVYVDFAVLTDLEASITECIDVGKNILLILQIYISTVRK